MRILVVSDIHAMSKDLASLSGGYAGTSGGIWKVEDRVNVSNPVLAMTRALKDQAGTIDLMLCLGDLAHQGKRLPLMIAWQDLQYVGQDLNIASVIGVVGNHDIISRANNSNDIEDLKEFIQLLRPSYPSNDSSFNTKYFADGVADLEIKNVLLIALNTCRTHGLGYEKAVVEEEFERGVLTDAMIDKILQLAAETSLEHIVIAMHHHPIALAGDAGGEKPIPKGEVLLSQLENLGKNVLVLHGHQHNVRLHRHSTKPKAPTILASASLCALPYPGQSSNFSNQFHLINFDTSVSAYATGTIHSWDWAARSWEKSSRQHMPYEVHFGPHIDIHQLAQSIRVLPRKPTYSKMELYSQVHLLKFFKLSEVDSLNALLEPDGLKLVVESGRIAALILEENAA